MKASKRIIKNELCWFQTCYEWMRRGLMDLEMETQMQLFQKEILRLEPSRLSEKGFLCFKCFFEAVNLKEHKLKKNNTLVGTVPVCVCA